MDRPLDGRVAIVTGASRGIGAEIARRFAAAGATVAVTARTMEQDTSRFAGSVAETVAEIEAHGGKALAVRADLSRPDEREQLVDTVVQALGPVDILVNNAAVTYFEPIADVSLKHLNLMLAVQVEAQDPLDELGVQSS